MTHDESRIFSVPEPRTHATPPAPSFRPPVRPERADGSAPAAGGPPPQLSGAQPGGARARLLAGIGRNPRSVLAALISTWFYVPFALVTALGSALLLGLVGFTRGLTDTLVPPFVVNLPLLGSALEGVLPRTGGVIEGMLGVLLGLPLGFLGGLLLFWREPFADPLTGLGTLVGVIGFGLAVGVVYTGYRMALEPLLLRMAGARRMSRREQALILPIAADCARRLGLATYPPILIDDRREPYAVAHTRHIVLSRGLLMEFQYDPEVIAGVLAHELEHWRNADAVSAAFVRGVALPLYLIHAAVGALSARTRQPLLLALVWLLTWPVLLTVRWFIMPVIAADARAEEFRADQGAVQAGYRDGLRRVLTRLDRSFETGHNGWTRTICQRHPAVELRLERLESPDQRYPLPDPAASPVVRTAPPPRSPR
ncbi:MAG TPA: M48 family metalloprotease [Natronosporangium sp.]|nr:M48 family metalloprotease [Natronosporangium sp.]